MVSQTAYYLLSSLAATQRKLGKVSKYLYLNNIY